jgi:Family of unknown function (DUF6941)
MLPFRVAAVVMCDDIRIEQNNKHILIGVYNGAIVVASFPAELQVCWWIQIFSDATGKIDLDLQLIKDEQAVLVRMEIGFETQDRNWAAMTLPKVPLQFRGPGHAKLQMKIKDGAEWTTVQEFAIKQGGVSVA